MKLIKIINGTYGYKAPGSKHIDPKQAGSPPFEVDDDEAKRLFDLGVSVYIVNEKPDATPDNGESNAVTGNNTPDGNASEKPSYSTEMKADELKELMKKSGLAFKVGMSKDDMVAALDEFFSRGDKETNDDIDDGEDPPSLSAENPVV